jgi:hypothetical protein
MFGLELELIWLRIGSSIKQIESEQKIQARINLGSTRIN